MGEAGARREQRSLRRAVPMTTGQVAFVAGVVLLFLGTSGFQLLRLDTTARDVSSDLAIVAAVVLLGCGLMIAGIAVLAIEQTIRQRR